MICTPSPDIFTAVSAAANMAALHAATQRAVKAFGFKSFFYQVVTGGPNTLGPVNRYTLSNFPDAWISRYQQERYALIDPTAIHARHHRHPIAWHSSLFTTPEAAKLREEATAFGISAGGSCPVRDSHSNATFVFSRAQDTDAGYIDALHALPYAHLLASCLHEAATRLLEWLPAALPELTQRELECLLLAAQGLRDLEIGERLNISGRTVLFHLTNVRTKLAAENRAQMIVLAIARGIVRL